MYLTIWSYKVAVDKKDEFEKMYGNKGAWVRLFSKYPDYIKTELFKDLKAEGTYLTLDYWKSQESYLTFRQSAEKEFKNIDELGENLTLEEFHIGEFLLV